MAKKDASKAAAAATLGQTPSASRPAAVREYVQKEIAKYEGILKSGPTGQGWKYCGQNKPRYQAILDHLKAQLAA